LLDLHGIRTLLALGRITAGFLYELGVTLQWEEVQLLARLGGWTPHEDRKPGKTTLTCGLRRLLDMLATRSYLDRYVAEHGDLPPRIAALLSQPAPEKLWPNLRYALTSTLIGGILFIPKRESHVAFFAVVARFRR